MAAIKKDSRMQSDSGRRRNQAYAEGIIVIPSLSKDIDVCLYKSTEAGCKDPASPKPTTLHRALAKPEVGF